MKRTRKGFTLVELLITIMIVAVLAATMTMPYIDSGTAKAKAATIAHNINLIASATTTKYALEKYEGTLGNLEDDGGKPGSFDAKVFVEYALPSFAGFNGEDSSIKYSASGGTSADFGDDSAIANNWKVVVNFTSDSEADGIAAELIKIAPFDAVSDDINNDKAFSFFFLKGKFKASDDATAD